MSAREREVTGWWNPTPFSLRQRVLYHYVGKDGRTLCGKWLFIGEGLVEEGRDEHRDNCAACKKRKAKLGGENVER